MLSVLSSSPALGSVIAFPSCLPSHAVDKCPPQGVSCGIPDFRSRDGLYASLKERGEWELDDPQQMCVRYLLCAFPKLEDFSNEYLSPCRFDIHYFRENPAGVLHSAQPASTRN
jgi:hypothetical protein